MTIYTHRFTEVHEEVDHAYRYPANLAPGTYNIPAFNMSNFQRAVFRIAVGVVPAGGTVNFYVTEVNPDTGAAVALYGKAITALTAADDNTVVYVEVRTEEMDVSDGYSQLAGVLTIGGASVPVDVTVLKTAANYVPVSTAAIDEIVD